MMEFIMEIIDVFKIYESGVAQVILEQQRQRLTAGTAFLVPGGIVTNSHVIRTPGAEVLCLRFSKMKEGELIRISLENVIKNIRYESDQENWDVVFISHNEPEFDGRYRFTFTKTQSLQVGQHVTFIGYPFQMEHITCHSGYISSFFEKNGVSVIQIDGSINGGNSGGPLIDLSSGLVAGIVTRAHIGFIAEQFDFLLSTLRKNVEVLESQKSILRIGNIDPIYAVKASQNAMLQIATSLRVSANVGIGFAYDSVHIRNAIEELGEIT
jgi:V8-like Glu-specific endopeptidase